MARKIKKKLTPEEKSEKKKEQKRKIKEKRIGELQYKQELKYYSNVTTLNVVVAAIEDFKTFLFHWIKPETEYAEINYYSHLDKKQIELNRISLEKYPDIIFRKYGSLISPIFVHSFLKTFSGFSVKLYDFFPPKFSDVLMQRMELEKKDAITRLKIKGSLFDEFVKAGDFYIHGEVASMIVNLEIILEMIEHNLKRAFKKIDDKNHEKYLTGVIQLIDQFLKEDVVEYIVKQNIEYTEVRRRLKEEKRILEESEAYKKEKKRAKRKESKKNRAPKKYFILGEEVTARRFKKELQYYQGDEYKVTSYKIENK